MLRTRISRINADEIKNLDMVQNKDTIIVNLTICHTREGGYPFSFGAVDSRLRGNDS